MERAAECDDQPDLLLEALKTQDLDSGQQSVLAPHPSPSWHPEAPGQLGLHPPGLCWLPGLLAGQSVALPGLLLAPP
eukprot:962273-Lingulodinium_polyedra.AAC.1